MPRIHWASRFGFIMATAGSAVGLGNIWKFPYITGKHGGGAFVLTYLLAIAFTGLPIFLAELYIGKASQKNVVEAFGTLSGQRHSRWNSIGWLGLASGFLILGFYSVVGGWVLEYLWSSLVQNFQNQSPDEVRSHLESLLASPARLILWHFVFMALTVAIVMGGIKDGIERWNKIMMPGLIVLLLLLFLQSVSLPGFGKALSFLFRPGFSSLSAEALLEAMGHSFFTLSLGLGSILTYGSYLEKNQKIASVALSVILIDTSVALLAGVVTLTAVFSFGLQPEAGPSLMFKTLPLLFAQMPGSYWVSLAFFLLVAFAALTSSISLLEPVIAYSTEKWNIPRHKSAVLMGSIAFVIGIFAALSFNILSGATIGKDTIFDFLNKLTTNLMLPLGGLGICLFYGWVLGPKAVEATLEGAPYQKHLAQGLLWTTRLVTPLAVLAVLLNGVLHW